jgi:hypothetical protein
MAMLILLAVHPALLAGTSPQRPRKLPQSRGGENLNLLQTATTKTLKLKLNPNLLGERSVLLLRKLQKRALSQRAKRPPLPKRSFCLYSFLNHTS